jgi:hypothetical protein
MKKYFITVLIPYLLLQFSGCYSIQKITKDDFSPSPDYPKLIVKTNNKEYTFEEGNYSFANDTIDGKIYNIIDGIYEPILIENVFEPFEGKISLNAVEEIELDEFYNTTEIPVLIVKTNEREFFFKSEESSYSVRNDTIYGKGKSRLRNDNQQHFEVAISINDVQEIQLDKFNLGRTIGLASIVVLSVVFLLALKNNFKLQVKQFK